METENRKDLIFAMICFAVISLILVFLMINSFKIIDCCYFILVLLFAARYLFLSKN